MKSTCHPIRKAFRGDLCCECYQVAASPVDDPVPAIIAGTEEQGWPGVPLPWEVRRAGPGSGEDYIAMAKALGAAKVLLKPFPLTVLIAAVNALLAGGRAPTQPRASR